MTLWMEVFFRIGCWATVVMTRGTGTMPISLFWSHPTQPNPTPGRPDTIKMLDSVPIQCCSRLPLQLVLYVLVFLNLCHHQVSNGSLFGVEKPPRCWLPKQLTTKISSHWFAWSQNKPIFNPLCMRQFLLAQKTQSPPTLEWRQYCDMCNCIPPYHKLYAPYHIRCQPSATQLMGCW